MLRLNGECLAEYLDRFCMAVLGDEDLADAVRYGFERAGYLQSFLFRAERLVVDTGLNHKRWTREQAIAAIGLDA